MAGPSQYKFNNAEDPNDVGYLPKAISAMKIGQPGSFGGEYISEAKCLPFRDSLIWSTYFGVMTGQFYNAGNKIQQYEQFNTRTPPDITRKTRVIAVLGIYENAAPDVDGWFVSDFFAFWNIFQGITDNQSWSHCLDLDALVAKHERYLHGNPYGPRKVVLDSDILAKANLSRHSPQRFKPHDLKIKTRELITAECKATETAKENVLILMFGHGDERNHGSVLGKGHGATMKIRELKRATKTFKVGITLITTSCYSGGWICHPQLNMSTITAAEKDNVSLSWRSFSSIGRACGSMFTTALVQKLTKIGVTNKSLGDGDDDENQDYTEDQEESYAEFTRTVHEHLVKDVDRRGYEHGLTFGAEDDAWQMCWGERTGIPLGSFKERWDKLEHWAKDATLHPGEPLNQDPAITDEQLAEYLHLRQAAKAKGKQVTSASEYGPSEATASVLGKRKTSGLYGGTNHGLIRMVSTLGAEYLNSFQGADDHSDHGGLHNTLKLIQSGQQRDMDIIEWAYRALDYRMTQMSTADKYLQMMGIAAPKGQLCCEYNTYNLKKEVGEVKPSTIYRLILDREVLFPYQIEGQGRPFPKGRQYLVAAFHHAQTPTDIVLEKLDTLVNTLDQALEREKEAVKRDPEVRSKRRKLFQAFGVALEDMSPNKRRSRGLSLTVST